MTIAKDELSKYFSELGKKGSKTTNSRYSKETRQRWARKAVQTRWAKRSNPISTNDKGK